MSFFYFRRYVNILGFNLICEQESNQAFVNLQTFSLTFQCFFYFFFQSGETSRRYDSYGKNCRNMNPPNDLSAFVKTLHIPDSMTVSKHIFSAPVNKPGNAPLQVGVPVTALVQCFLISVITINRSYLK